MAKAPRAPSAPPPPGATPTVTKNFTVAPWTGEGEGEKIILYGPSGMGKTTLASMAPSPVFIGTDDGGRRIRDPRTGAPILHVPDVDSFADVRATLKSNVFDDHETVVIDTGTNLQHWALPFMFQTIKHDKGHTVQNIEGYGYGKGYRHFFDTMHLIPVDLDRLVRRGKNVIVICQEVAVTETNPGGEDYTKSGPDLYHTDKNSVRNDYISWADHVFRIGWESATVDKKKITPVEGRKIDVRPDASFVAKSRGNKFDDYPAVSFSEPADDSLWTILFGE